MPYVVYIGKNQQHSTERYVRHALRQHGYDVNLLAARKGVYDKAWQSIQARRPEFVLFSKPHFAGCREFLSQCRSDGIPTVCWLWDLYMGYRSDRPAQFDADYLFTSDGGHEGSWADRYPRHQVLRQGIHRPHHVMFDRPFAYDVAFVGSRGVRGHPWRTEMIEYMKKRYGDRFVMVRNTRGMALNELLATIKVVVGDSVPSPRYWSNRIYEVLGRGGFLLHPHTLGLDQEFTDGEHYIGFSRADCEALGDVVDYYIQHDDDREHVRRAGFDLVGCRYTYEDRVGVLLERIGVMP